MPADNFQPLYLTQGDLGTFGLPSPCQTANIMTLVAAASTAIDVFCQKQDSDGYGSLVYSTYTDIVPIKRNSIPTVFRITKRPMAAVSAIDLAMIVSSGSVFASSATGAMADLQPYDNGAIASTQTPLNTDLTGGLCSIIAISGRFAPTRPSQVPEMPLNYINPLAIGGLYGGVPLWFALDPTLCDYDPKMGRIMAPSGLYFTQFSEMSVTYTSGFNPFAMPRNIKQACANIVQNMLTKPIPGVTAATYSQAAMSLQFSKTYIDDWTCMLLRPYVNTIYG